MTTGPGRRGAPRPSTILVASAVVAATVLALTCEAAAAAPATLERGAARGRATVAASLVVALQETKRPPPADEFVPIKDLPPREELPAAPLLIAAYIIVWGALMVYVITLWRRLAKVERELQSVSRQIDQGRRT
jgi:CcmD family protein